ncbi:heavy metal transporter putative zinc transporter [Thalassiosira pseudonana CCMP1335]|uniref:Heavy metal transporter putative zinc transporter n=1 Tax=Thalassiosira pseudonana TaxID=35128 RepID=B8BTN9_THAPS|nr:heavy metal transporter putative zinc transporter [Thalassiosira pseudonana CCMP1335]EED94634.1 heavy metal transporter putative zinc transporter [Thalassiosira pseudonana CCMP1335]
MTTVSSENVGTALLLVVAAGAATAIGAAVVFFPSLVKLASRRVLAASLGLSAGVMTYVSFVEIFAKSVVAFEAAELGEEMAYIYATLSFFGGVLVMKVSISIGPSTPHCVGCSDDPHEGDDPKLIRMGLCTAVAIAIHNFPEGLATFVAALEDPHVGAVLAIAIGLHNIPEGLCVALPIYYATGNRKKAFLWGCLSGLSEPVAALLGWAVLAKSMSQEVYATLFGLVSGMMVIISMKELLPTAHRYDPEDTVVTYSLIGGMALIALSLVLFKV